jgi:hypothetical protein
MPTPHYGCFEDERQQAWRDAKAVSIAITLRNFMRYAALNRDEKPLCVMHELTAEPGSASAAGFREALPRNSPFFSGDLFDVLDRRPPKDFLCIEPVGGGT